MTINRKALLVYVERKLITFQFAVTALIKEKDKKKHLWSKS